MVVTDGTVYRFVTDHLGVRFVAEADLIATVLLSMAAVVAVVLLVPISARADGALGEDELWGVAELRWGHSIAMVRVGSEVGGQLYLFGIPLFRLPAISKPGEDEKKKRKGPKLGRLLSQDPRVLASMMARGLRALHPQLHIGGTVGLGDPADTAFMLTAVRRIDLLVTDRIELDLRDDLLEDTTQLFGRMRAWMIPAEIGLILLLWVIRSESRQVLRGQIMR